MRVVILLTTLAFSVLYLFYNPSGQVGFMFSDTILSADTWVYFLFEHIILVLLAIVIVELEPRYKLSAITYLFIQLADTLDYILTYGEPWFSFISWNMIKILIFIMAITYERWKLLRTGVS